ncbi:hypothetical protein ABFU66_10315 [Xanthomonas campestris pv. raphani]
MGGDAGDRGGGGVQLRVVLLDRLEKGDRGEGQMNRLGIQL